MSPKRTQSAARKTAEEYSVRICARGVLPEPELSTCVEIVRDGWAVPINLEKFQNAKMLAVVRTDGVIVGVGSIERDRPERAAAIAQRSGFGFPQENLELGYVAVAPAH